MGAKSDFHGPLLDPHESFESAEEPTRAEADSGPPEIVGHTGEVLLRLTAPGHNALRLMIRQADLMRGIFLRRCGEPHVASRHHGMLPTTLLATGKGPP